MYDIKKNTRTLELMTKLMQGTLSYVFNLRGYCHLWRTYPNLVTLLTKLIL